MLASIFGDNIEAMIPIFGITGFFLTFIIFVLLGHQRRMAEILRSNPQNQNAAAADPQLQKDLEALREMVTHQTIAIDNLAAEQARLNKALQTDQALRDHLRASS